MRLTKAEVTAGFCALCIAACNPVETVSKAYSLWANEPIAQEAYPDLNPQQAQLRYANDKMRALLSQLPTQAERQLAAAHFYYGFQHTNSRAVVAYCAQVGVDVSRFSRIFKSMHHREEAAAKAILTAHGVSEESVWSQKKARAIAAAQYALVNARDNAQTDMICRDMKENPGRYLVAQTFSAHFPYAMAVMETPVQTAQNSF